MEQLCIKYVQQTSNPLIPRPCTPGAPSLTIHCRHECQVKNLPNQHLQEANLQRKNEKAEICSGPKGSLRDPPPTTTTTLWLERKPKSISRRIWELQPEPLDSRTTKPETHLVHLLLVQMGRLRSSAQQVLVQGSW